MKGEPFSPGLTPRLVWVDIAKGISILWIAFFHYFKTYAKGRYPWPLDPGFLEESLARCDSASLLFNMASMADSLFAAISHLGFHAVGVFLFLSGFGLAHSLAKTGTPQGGWMGWYRTRLLRLFPLYWIAHILYLISPFMARPESIDSRFFLSFLGDRVYPIESLFYYMNPAWWFVGLLLQLYLVFPFLFRMLQKRGIARFLLTSMAVTLASRTLLLFVLHADGDYLQGGFFGSRLFEFTAGMALGFAYRRNHNSTDSFLFNRKTVAGGILVYTLGIESYLGAWSYLLTDSLIGVGLSILVIHMGNGVGRHLPGVGSIMARIGVYSYGLYLLHQPYVIYLGEHTRQLAVFPSTILALAVIGAIALLAAGLEKSVNRFVNPR